MELANQENSKVEFIVSGETGADRSRKLRELFQLWQKTGASPMVQLGTGLTVRVIITNPQRTTSVAHCISYACSELTDGIVEAGGTIWDGTHVQSTQTLDFLG